MCTLNLSRCDLDPESVIELQTGVSHNQSLHELNLTGAQVNTTLLFLLSHK